MNPRFALRSLSLAIACSLAILPPNLTASETIEKPDFKGKPAGVKPDAQGRLRYIVRLQSAPLALYNGDKTGLPATSPKITGERHLNMRSTAVLSYQSYLARERETVMQTMRSTLQRDVPALKTYSVVLHGFVAELTPAEARRVAHLPGVAKVSPDRILKPQTDRGPHWIGAPTIWNGAATGIATQGEGVIIGILDTGINPANPSFADIGADGYDHTNPAGRRFGVCDPANPRYNRHFACSDKLIGAYDFTINTRQNPFNPLDIHGHGSHTASTAAGNVVEAKIQMPTTTLTRKISGVAPHANLISYRVCESIDSCSASNDIAAIEQAILDGVDVINHSIGGDDSFVNPWDEDYELAFLSAHTAGIVVANSAGNDGPDAGTVGTPQDAPWLMSVGAATHDRVINNGVNGLVRSDGVKLPHLNGKGLTAGYGPAPIVYAGQVPNPNDAVNASGLCAAAYPAGTFHGEIVICDRGFNARVDKGKNVLAGGAGGMILVNVAHGARDVVVDSHFLPATHLSAAHGKELKDWLKIGSGHQGKIAPYRIVIDPSAGDIMASFSSRGPNLGIPELLKPDLVAPGVDILAAGGVKGDVAYQLMSGTSMASPHVAGSAALLKSLHPDWSPDEIKSALMTTAKIRGLRDSDGKSAVNVFGRGAGRIDLYNAARAGLVMDEEFLSYLKADPAKGGNPSSLNLPSMAQAGCVSSCNWERIVRNPGANTVNWSAVGVSTADIQLTVTPSNFTLAPGASKTLTIKATATAATKPGIWRFGQINLEADQANIAAAHLPVAVKFIASDLPPSVQLKGAGATGSSTLAVKAGIPVSQLSSRIDGLVPAVVYEASIHQNDTLYLDIDVPAGTRRLVTEIRNAVSPDLDLYLYRLYTINGDTIKALVCSSADGDSQEYCNIDKPSAATYRVEIDGYATSDPSGNQADNFELSTGLVGHGNANNFNLAGSQTSAAQGQSFNLKLNWNVAPPTKIWYGAFSVGADTANPANLGKSNIDLYLN